MIHGISRSTRNLLQDSRRHRQRRQQRQRRQRRRRADSHHLQLRIALRDVLRGGALVAAVAAWPLHWNCNNNKEDKSRI